MVFLDKSCEEHVAYLSSALYKFQKEVFPKKETNVDVQMFIDYHFSIYLAVSNNNEFVGFTSFNYNGYFGIKSPTIGNTYLFIEKSHRRSNAMHLMSIQSGKVCEQAGLPLEHYIVDGGGSEKFVGRLNGKKIYTTYEFDASEVLRETQRIETIVKIKGNKDVRKQSTIN